MLELKLHLRRLNDMNRIGLYYSYDYLRNGIEHKHAAVQYFGVCVLILINYLFVIILCWIYIFFFWFIYLNLGCLYIRGLVFLRLKESDTEINLAVPVLENINCKYT